MATLTQSYARHESFHPRIGWLSKAVHATDLDPEIFGRESAIVDLGVGKNMVRAIRYWGLATKVIELRNTPKNALRPTPFGDAILGEGGLDPYGEDSTTLWLLHWSLLRDPVIAPTWWWVFNEVELVDFAQPQLVKAEVDWVLSLGSPKPAQASIERDIDCLVRMYARRPGHVDPIDSPFASLGLMEPVPGATRRWRFVSGPKDSLEPLVVLLASVAHMIDTAPEAQTISVARLATARGGPGRVFRLTDSSIAVALRAAAALVPDVSVNAPGGLTQLAVRGDKRLLGARVLASCYGRSASPVAEAITTMVNWLMPSGGMPS